MATATLTTISAQDLKQQLQSDRPPVLINVLSREVYRKRRVPGSISVPQDDIDQVQQIVPDTAQPIVVYCANADCTASPESAERLEELGYTNVHDFEGGLAGWRQAGFDLIGEEG